MSRVIAAEAWPSIRWTVLTFAPALIARLAVSKTAPPSPKPLTATCRPGVRPSRRIVRRRGRVVLCLRVTRLRILVGEVASPQQRAKLGVPVAELVEEN